MQQQSNSLLFGGNAPFVEEIYENYLANPASVSDEWRSYFDKLAQMPGNVAKDVPHAPVIAAFAEMAKQSVRPVVVESGEAGKRQAKAMQMVNAYRSLGTRWADLDPLQRTGRPLIPQLDPAYYEFTDADMNAKVSVGSFKGTGSEEATVKQLLDAVRETYCGSVGVEYMYMSDINEKRWLQARIEPTRGKKVHAPERKKRYLERLTAAETLERYLHTRYVGQKRFSLEGGEALISSMDELIHVGGQKGVQEIVIGMAHRGRLNVLVNTLGKQPAMLFAEFEGKKAQALTAGDVKYH
ncbi:MAG TPA: 2-oxoglutarate dehydrogenase E1 component, partial [Rhodocyclaceae bacterium]|nr:2-oxoglutarate dehydrogenase E1 component [Rhodocyclaceae bacterium]